MTVEFDESGMRFGPFPASDIFRIEHSPTYEKAGQGMKMAEFILFRPDASRLWVVEAKSSSPRAENIENFAAYIGEIRDKMTNALLLALGLSLGRHGPEGAAELPTAFQRIDPATLKIQLVLVIKGHPQGWLPAPQDALRKALAVIVRSLGLGPNSVVVINDEMAARHRLITNVPA